MVGELKAGRTVVIADVRRDPLTDAAAAQQTYERMQIVSMICVPLLRSQRLVAVMAVCDGTPRTCGLADAEIVAQVAERTLFAVEGARAAVKLRKNHDVLALAMGAGKKGAWSRDLALDTVWWRPELATLFGLDPADHDYRRMRLFDLVGPEDRERLPVAIDAALLTRQDYAVEFRFRHAVTGAWRWMEARGKATYDGEGHPRMLYGLGIDITEQQRAVDALREADRRKDDFLATLAHELRNPLAPISSGLHILKFAGHDAAAAAQAREIMERQVAQMIRLVDDNADAAESLAMLLSLGGHDTRTAHDGETAIHAAADFRPDIVFLDIGMPTMDGHETARRMRAEPWGQSLVTVALTGWGQTEDRRRSSAAGFNHHLVKPADPAVVSKLIASL